MSSYRAAIDQLSAAQKPAYGAPAYSRFVNRPAGRRIAARAYALNLTPNAVTGISALLSAIGILVLALAPISIWTGMVVAAALALGYAFDSADGQLARLTNTGGPAGEWLDHVVDMGKTVLVPGAIVYSLVIHTDPVNARLVALAIGFAAVSVVAFFAWLLVDLLRRADPAPVPTEARAVGHAPLIRSILRLPSDYGVLCWIFVLWGVPPLGGVALFWWAYGLLFAANFVILLVALPVWYRQAKAVGQRSY